MKELLLQYAQYNVWANKRIIEAMLKLDDGLIDKDIISSFRSLRLTSYHMFAAEYVWQQRVQLVEHPQWIQDTIEGTFQEACAAWQEVSAHLVQFVKQQHDNKALQHVCAYTNRAGHEHKTPVYQILQHIFNHNTYHRGQLVTMLRQVSDADIPSTDLIAFVWGK